jgi:succinyl-CoA synthetase beta subunit
MPVFVFHLTVRFMTRIICKMTHDEALEMSEALRVIREDPHLWEEFVNIANGILQDEINKEVIKAIYDAATKENDNAMDC